MLTDDKLRSYLAWAIHGRKPQRRVSSPTRNRPPRDEVYLARIREILRIACGIEGRSEAAHSGTDGGMSQKASDHSCVPLCADCHRQASGAYHRIGKRAFEERRGISFARIVERLNAEWRNRSA
jgi:hypothetical protein